MGGRLLISDASRPGRGQQAGEPDHGAQRLAPPRPHVQRHHRPLAEADQGAGRGRQAVARQLRVDKGVQRRRGRLHSGRQTIQIHAGDREPLVGAAREARHRLGRVRCDEGGFGHSLSEIGCQPDQVVAVGAVPVREDDQLARRAARGGCDPRSVQRLGHQASSPSTSRGMSPRLSSEVIVPQQVRGHAAIGLPHLGAGVEGFLAEPRMGALQQPYSLLQR